MGISFGLFQDIRRSPRLLKAGCGTIVDFNYPLAAFTGVAILLQLVSAQTAPTVSLLIDSSTRLSAAEALNLNLRSVLSQVSSRKGATFHFGSTYSTPSSAEASWTSTKFSTFWNHIVAENDCKWYATEPTRGTFTLSACEAVSAYANEHGATFRGHNTFWHQQLPSWLPGSVTATDLVQNVIPTHVAGVIKGLGSNVTSWDVMNELITDSATTSMNSYQCVQNADRWPTVTADGGSTALETNLQFVYAAFKTALSNFSFGRLVYNDYSTGGSDAKDSCVFKLLADINANASIPYNRLAVGYQSHVGAQQGYFVPKAQLEATFSQLNSLGAQALITEMDMWIAKNDTVDQRYQAAIWGDYLDACLYAPNCFEFINWDNRDDTSWITAGNGHGVAMATLFDLNGNPKTVTYELIARLQRYASGATEMCATALGTSSCTVPST